jgi:hypothetical protein
MREPSKRESAGDRPADDDRRESGNPGGGAGRRDEVGPTGVYPMSGGVPPGKHPELRTPASWGQGDRGPEGYEDSGGSELYMHDGQLLGGLTAGPGGEPTIDIHGGDHTGAEEPETADDSARRPAKDDRHT